MVLKLTSHPLLVSIILLANIFKYPGFEIFVWLPLLFWGPRDTQVFWGLWHDPSVRLWSWDRPSRREPGEAGRDEPGGGSLPFPEWDWDSSRQGGSFCRWLIVEEGGRHQGAASFKDRKMHEFFLSSSLLNLNIWQLRDHNKRPIEQSRPDQ